MGTNIINNLTFTNAHRLLRLSIKTILWHNLLLVGFTFITNTL